MLRTAESGAVDLPGPQILDEPGKASKDEQSNLLKPTVIYDEKSFIPFSTGHCVHISPAKAKEGQGGDE